MTGWWTPFDLFSILRLIAGGDDDLIHSAQKYVAHKLWFGGGVDIIRRHASISVRFAARDLPPNYPYMAFSGGGNLGSRRDGK
jgi:hypothetical protein